MVFTSLNFILFFPSVVILFFLIPKKIRWQFLLIVSLFFYANVQPFYAILLVIVSFVTYKFAILIEKEIIEKRRERYLIVGLMLIFLPLFLFKYYNFVNESMFTMLDYFGLRFNLPKISLLLPIGISFYTFMAIGYLVDVYNEEIKAEKNFGLITLFLSFFPLVLSGPIERAPSMLPQFRHKLDFNYQKAVNGLQLILWGYFMKLVVADRLGIYIEAVFGNIEHHSGKTLLLAVLIYPWQLYCDLGGYSLIAIGAANVMGINVRPNFNRPFFATSLSEFWRRWHMSLITWILDYIYTPLSFVLRRFRMKGVVLALVITFFVMGMWHGATITFLMWALYQVIIIGIEAITKNKKFAFEQKYNLTNKTWYISLSIILTYFLFAFSFLTGGNTHTFSDGILAFNKIFTDSNPLFLGKVTLPYAFIGIIMLFLSDFRDEFFPNKFLLFKNENVYIRWSSYVTILLFILAIGVFGKEQFIYFKF